MRYMRERDEIRLTEDLHPWDRLLSVPIPLELLDVRLVGSSDLVAPHAELDRWDAGDRRAAGIGMAIQARDLIVPSVDLVTEVDRLCGRLLLKTKERKSSNGDKNHKPEQNNTEPLHRLWPPPFFRARFMVAPFQSVGSSDPRLGELREWKIHPGNGAREASGISPLVLGETSGLTGKTILLKAARAKLIASCCALRTSHRV
jgi:hypothetical protein